MPFLLRTNEIKFYLIVAHIYIVLDIVSHRTRNVQKPLT